MAAEVTAHLRLQPVAAGGIQKPLKSPTPSLVFRPVDADAVGLVGVIHVPGDADLSAGTELEARVVFPQDDADPFIEKGGALLTVERPRTSSGEVKGRAPRLFSRLATEAITLIWSQGQARMRLLRRRKFGSGGLGRVGYNLGLLGILILGGSALAATVEAGGRGAEGFGEDFFGGAAFAWLLALPGGIAYVVLIEAIPSDRGSSRVCALLLTPTVTAWLIPSFLWDPPAATSVIPVVALLIVYGASVRLPGTTISQKAAIRLGAVLAVGYGFALVLAAEPGQSVLRSL